MKCQGKAPALTKAPGLRPELFIGYKEFYLLGYNADVTEEHVASIFRIGE
jgi:hypothetical protein